MRLPFWLEETLAAACFFALIGLTLYAPLFLGAAP